MASRPTFERGVRRLAPAPAIGILAAALVPGAHAVAVPREIVLRTGDERRGQSCVVLVDIGPSAVTGDPLGFALQVHGGVQHVWPREAPALDNTQLVKGRHVLIRLRLRRRRERTFWSRPAHDLDGRHAGSTKCSAGSDFSSTPRRSHPCASRAAMSPRERGAPAEPGRRTARCYTRARPRSTMSADVPGWREREEEGALPRSDMGGRRNGAHHASREVRR
jgi:hypothetical protein